LKFGKKKLTLKNILLVLFPLIIKIIRESVLTFCKLKNLLYKERKFFKMGLKHENGNFTFILLTGGSGTRFNNSSPKQFAEFLGKPLMLHSLDTVKYKKQINQILIPAQESYLKKTENLICEYIEKSRGFTGRQIKIIPGGKTRQESVYSALKYCTNQRVLIHDSSRPLVSAEDISKIAEEKEENVIFGIPVSFSILEQEKGFIKKIFDRKDLINIQTPQKFNLQVLFNSHEKALKEGLNFTDDASLVFHYGGKVKIIPGNNSNIKITFPEDLQQAEALYKMYYGK